MQPTDVGVSWLPLYHDMGLIGAWLNCLHHGLPLTLMPPTAFLARPERWLWAIHERRATLSAAPNFAYELCARRIADEALEGLDLSSWRVALNGAEPVSPGTLERFARRFAPPRLPARRDDAGLRPRRVLGGARVPADRARPARRSRRARAVPARGAGSRGRARATRPRSSSSRPAASCPSTRSASWTTPGDVAERVVGRLAFRGPSMTSGYYKNPEATAAITLPGGWLDSGDLAYRADGEIHICGRRKDLIIKGGRNLVPQEIEEAAAAVEGDPPRLRGGVRSRRTRRSAPRRS